MTTSVAKELTLNKIIIVRGQKVILDSDIAALYGIETKVLNQSVNRNKDRFPRDFMFTLTQKEFSDLRSQIVTSSLENYGGRRYRPKAFTEEGVAMLSSVIRSKKAIQVNIAIMRAFVQINKVIFSNIELAQKIKEIERKVELVDTRNSKELSKLYALLRELIIQEETEPAEIGFNLNS